MQQFAFKLWHFSEAHSTAYVAKDCNKPQSMKELEIFPFYWYCPDEATLQN